jgi:hypothetical protein
LALKSWEEDEAAICAEVRARRAPLKIVLKTKNERLLLRGMVEHHLPIVGAAGLAVFDNGSTDPDVLRYLDDLSATVPVYRFAAFHNSMHQSFWHFAPLYAALRVSSDYYTILDTDERLYWFDPDGTYRADASVAERIVGTGHAAVPGIWALNVPGEEPAVRFTLRRRRLLRGIRNGKLILSSRVEPPRQFGHNWQAPASLFAGGAIGNAVIVHLKNMSPAQRIAANLEKLSSYSRCHGLLKEAGLTGDVTLEQVLAIDTAPLIDTARRYVAEIRALVRAEPEAPFEDGGGKRLPELRLADGRLVFADARECREILDFLRDPAATITEALTTADRALTGAS